VQPQTTISTTISWIRISIFTLHACDESIKKIEIKKLARIKTPISKFSCPDFLSGIEKNIV